MVRRKYEDKGCVLQHESALKKKRQEITESSKDDIDPGIEAYDKRDVGSASAPNFTEADAENYTRHLKGLFRRNKLSAKDLQESAELSSKAGAGGADKVRSIGN